MCGEADVIVASQARKPLSLPWKGRAWLSRGPGAVSKGFELNDSSGLDILLVNGCISIGSAEFLGRGLLLNGSAFFSR